MIYKCKLNSALTKELELALDWAWMEGWSSHSMGTVDWRPVFVLRNNATGTCRGSIFKPGIHYAGF